MSRFFSTKTIDMLSILIILLCITNIVQSADFTEIRAMQTVYQVNNPHSFQIGLDFDQAFQVDFNPPPDAGPRCNIYPSALTINSASSSIGPWADFTQDETLDADIEVYSGKYFLLSSDKFKVAALGGPIKLSAARDTEVYANGPTIGRVFMVIDSLNHMLYTINSKNAFSYDLNAFLMAAATSSNPTPTPIPDITNRAIAPISYTSVLAVKFYEQRIYIVADNVVEVYKPDAAGTLTYLTRFNAAFFGVTSASIVDITFRGNYAFVLDKMLGIFIVDISSSRAGVTDMAIMFQHMPGLKITCQRGRFIEVSGSTLVVVSETTSIIYEYFIEGDPIITEINFNRHILAVFGNLKVKRVYIDNNYLYIISNKLGFYVLKHSIPERFDDPLFQDANPLFVKGLRPLTSTSSGKSKLLGLVNEWIYEIDISMVKSYLSCTAEKLPGCVYVFSIQGIQRSCASKAASSLANNVNTVCIISQKVSIVMINEAWPCPPSSIAPAPSVPSTPSSPSGIVHNNPVSTGNNISSNPANSTKSDNSNNNRTQIIISNSIGQNDPLSNLTQNNTLNGSLSTDTGSIKTLQNDGVNSRAQEEAFQQKETIESKKEQKEVMIMLIAVFISVGLILAIFVGGLILWLRKERKHYSDQDQATVQVPRLGDIVPRAFTKARTQDNHRFIKPAARAVGEDDSRIDFGHDVSNISGFKTAD